jgi:hypothetical protein
MKKLTKKVVALLAAIASLVLAAGANWTWW